MLSNARVGPGLPAGDFERAKAFYRDTLGLPLKEEVEGNATFACGEGTTLTVFESAFAGTNQATAAGFEVEDIEAEMKDLRSRGAAFEEYDLPGLRTVNGVATFDGNKVSNFKDTEGNILSLAQRG